MKLRLVAVVMLVLAVTVAYAQPGAGKGAGKAGGERRGGGMRGVMGIDQDWAALCFEINMSAEQVAKLRPTFQWAWKTRNAALKSAMASRSFEAAGKTMASVSKTVDERIKIVLTSAQKAQWTKYKADLATMREKMRGAGGRPGGGKAK